MLKQVYKDKWKLGKQGADGSGMSGESITGGGDQVRDPGMGGAQERRECVHEGQGHGGAPERRKKCVHEGKGKRSTREEEEGVCA